MTQETQSAFARAVIGISGDDARDFLNGLLTNSVAAPSPDGPVFAALLTPQGKILHTLFVHDAPDGVWLDVLAEGADDLIRRLTLYRLRRKIGIEDLRGQMDVKLEDGAGDPRHPDLPGRAIVEGAARNDWAAYDAARLSLGVPDQGRDYGPEEVFPADANLDLLHGVDLKKGCFVGQEVVSRMHRRGAIRKRMARIVFTGDAPDYGAEITGEAGGAVGAVRSTGRDARGHGTGIALVRLDRLAEAQGGLQAAGTALTVIPPEG
jgi:folate-binding protein YgfZ